MDKSERSALPPLKRIANQQSNNKGNNKVHMPENPKTPNKRAPRRYRRRIKKQQKIIEQNTDDNEEEDFNEFDSLEALTVSRKATYKSILFSQTNKNGESVTFTTFIEFDLHGSDIYIFDAFDWIIHIRDSLLSAHEQEVDFFHFIPGRGCPHKKFNPKTKRFEIVQKEPTLRPLLLITLKRMGFDCYQQDGNEGYFICPIKSYQCNVDNEQVIKNQKSLYCLFGCDENVFDDDQENMIKTSFNEIMKQFPTMPKFCAELISLWKKKSTESVKCASKFEKYYKSKYIDLKKDNDKLKLLEKENIELIINDQKNEYEEKLTNTLCNHYHFDPFIIKRIVHETNELDKVVEILNQMNEMNPDYLTQFVILSQKYNFIPIITLLEISEERKHNLIQVKRHLSNPSVMQFSKAVKVLDVSTKITSDRIKKYQPKDFNKPKFIHSIQINVEHAGKEKAMNSISRTIDKLGTGEIGEMILVFSNIKKENICSSDEILPLIYKKVNDRYFIHIDKEKENEIYHCYIKSQNN